MTNEVKLKEKMELTYKYLDSELTFHIGECDTSYYMRVFVSKMGSMPTMNIFKKISDNNEYDITLADNKEYYRSIWFKGNLSEMLELKNKIVLEVTNHINNWITNFKETLEPIRLIKQINCIKYNFLIYPRKSEYDAVFHPYGLIVERLISKKDYNTYFKQPQDISVLEYEISKTYKEGFKPTLFFKGKFNDLIELKYQIIRDLKNLK